MKEKPEPQKSFHFSIKRLLFLTSSWAVLLVVLPLNHESPILRVIVTAYLLFVISWCIMFSYSQWQRLMERRQELKHQLEQEYKQARDNPFSTDE